MKEQDQLPDFILGGAPKSATSSLCGILKAHDDVFVCGENDFFTIDDVAQHPNYLALDGRRNVLHDYEADFDDLLAWYRDLFSSACYGQKIGDYSTNYFASAKAPRRIRDLLPDCKLIFMLRDPVDRTYSEYWHHLKRGRVTRSFEEAIQFAPRTMLKNSRYEEAARRYLRLFPRENVRFVFFERFIRDTQSVVDAVCEFLHLPGKVDTTAVKTRRNTARTPRWPRVQRVLNRLFQQTVRWRGSQHLPHGARKPMGWGARAVASLEMRLRVFNLKAQKPPSMNTETRAFLERFFAKENRGLADLIGIDVSEYWSYM